MKGYAGLSKAVSMSTFFKKGNVHYTVFVLNYFKRCYQMS